LAAIVDEAAAATAAVDEAAVFLTWTLFTMGDMPAHVTTGGL